MSPIVPSRLWVSDIAFDSSLTWIYFPHSGGTFRRCIFHPRRLTGLLTRPESGGDEFLAIADFAEAAVNPLAGEFFLDAVL